MGQELQGTGGLRKVERVQGIREAELFQPIDKGSMQGSSQGEGPEVKCTQGEVGCRMIILLVHRAPPSSSASIFAPFFLGMGKDVVGFCLRIHLFLDFLFPTFFVKNSFLSLSLDFPPLFLWCRIYTHSH